MESIYWPGNNVNLLPPEYSSVKALIARGEYENAVKALEVLLKKNSFDRIAVALLSDIYLDHTGNYSMAVKVLSDFLNRQDRVDEDVLFVLKLSDALMEMGKDDLSGALIGKELKNKYSQKVAVVLEKRLKNI